jgi:hypothetical protein
LPNIHGGVELAGLGVLKFDWERLAKLVDVLGPDFDTKLSKAALNYDLQTITVAISIGLGGVDADEIKRASPPLISAVGALMAALNIAFHGGKEPPQDAGENPPKRKSAATSSATRGGKRSKQG